MGLLEAIEASAHLFFGRDATLIQQGSVVKHTSTLQSDFDYHIATPSRAVVTKDDMPDFRDALHSLPEADLCLERSTDVGSRGWSDRMAAVKACLPNKKAFHVLIASVSHQQRVVAGGCCQE